MHDAQIGTSYSRDRKHFGMTPSFDSLNINSGCR